MMSWIPNKEIIAGVIFLLSWLFAVGLCRADLPPNQSSSLVVPDNHPAPVGTIAEGSPLTLEEVRGLSNAIVRVEERDISQFKIEEEINEAGVERKIYLLKLDSGTAPDREMLELQKSLLENQLAVMRVLGVLGTHQGMLGKKLVRMENLDQEMLLGMKDSADGMDNARLDLAGNLAETMDLTEISSEIHKEVLEIQKQISNLETAIDGVADTTDEILDVVDSVGTGGF